MIFVTKLLRIFFKFFFIFKTRRFLGRLHEKRKQPAFYSRPSGLDSEKRELLLDKIRKHLDSLPVFLAEASSEETTKKFNFFLFIASKPHPRSSKEVADLHEKAQKEFQNYVINQRSIRLQQQKIQVLLAMTNNDADLLLS